MEYKYIKLTRSLIEELISHELSRSTEFLLKCLDETIIKYKLLDRPDSAYTKVRLRIKDNFCANNYTTPRFDKYYPLFSAKEKIAIDLVSNFSSIVKSLEYHDFGMIYDIHFYKPDGTPNGGILDLHINAGAWSSEFFEMKGWISINLQKGTIRIW